ncbi:MAG TPA: TolC family protein, partial [Calditrichia bacterium]|nr:TolC family protein [Calditrichia bacterium]
MTQYLVLLILFTLSAAAQSAFSLEDAWKMALEKNLSLQREKAVLQSTQKQVEIERSSLLPSLAVVAGLSYTSELPQLNLPVNLPGVSGLEVGGKDKYDVAIQASQALFTG